MAFNWDFVGIYANLEYVTETSPRKSKEKSKCTTDLTLETSVMEQSGCFVKSNVH